MSLVQMNNSSNGSSSNKYPPIFYIVKRLTLQLNAFFDKTSLPNFRIKLSKTPITVLPFYGLKKNQA